MEKKINKFKKLNIFEGILCGAVLGFSIGFAVGFFILGDWTIVLLSTILFAFLGIFLIYLDLSWFFNFIKYIEEKKIG